MKKNLYIHIGTAKTGSTAIQKYLFKNNGMGYKHLTSDQYHNPLSIIRRIKQHNIDTIIDEIESTNYENYIFSNEFLYHGPSHEDIKYLAKQFSKYNTTIICYVRRQDHFVQSVISQLIRSNVYKSSGPFINFVNSHINYNTNDTDNTIRHANYFEMLSLWSLEFKNVIVIKYEKSSFYKNDLIADFFKHINIKTKVKESEIANKSLSLNVIAYLKAVLNNELKLNASHNEFAQYLIDNLEKLEDNVTAISYENRKKIIESYSESNKKLCKKYNIEPFEDIIEEQYKNFFDIDSVTLEQAKDVVNEFNKVHLK